MFAQIIPIVMMLFYLAMQAVQLVHDHANRPNQQIAIATVQATDFILYKDAIQNYVEEEPGTTGEIASTSLTALGLLPVGVTLPPQAGNFISSDGNGGYDIVVWYQPSGQMSYTQTQFTGTNVMQDGTVGYALGSSFYPFLYPTQPQTLPHSPPGAGYVVSYDDQTSNGAPYNGE